VAVAPPGEADRCRQELERHALRFRALDLLHETRHLGPGPSVEHADLGAETSGGAGAVHGGVPAADHDNVPAQLRRFALGDPPQELDPRERQVLALAAQPRGQLGPDAEEDGVVITPEIGEAEVAAPPRVHAKRGPEALDLLDLGVQGGSRQAVLGDAVAQHPAGQSVGVEEGAAVSALEQVESGGQSRRARADDRHRLAGRLPGLGQARPLRHLVPVGDVAVERSDRQPLVVVVAAAAALLAQPRAHPPQGARERQPVEDPLHRPIVLTGGDLVDEARHVEPGRATGGAGGDALPGVVG